MPEPPGEAAALLFGEETSHLAGATVRLDHESARVLGREAEHGGDATRVAVRWSGMLSAAVRARAECNCRRKDGCGG